MLNTDCYEKKPRKKIKVREIDFEIPKYSDYDLFKRINYPLNFLKEICNYYSLKKSGNKPDLNKRIEQFLYNSFFILKIQKIFKGYLIRKEIKLRGPAFLNKTISNNQTDFLTFENIDKINNNSFFSFKDNKNIWSFNIISIYNIFLKSTNNQFLNPYTRENLPIDTFSKLKKIINLTKLRGFPIDVKINQDDDDSISYKKKLDLKALELFQYINNLGNYSDYNWYINLSKRHIIRFLRELQDIWMYRAQLSIETQREICYPYGNPFRYIDLTRLSGLSYIQIFKNGLNVIEQFIKKGTNKDNCSLGSSYVLCALTLVNYEAANALPWLYESVANAL